jgi:hypothetical protein
MFRNVAGQIITAQLVSKTDGSDVTTGTTTVYGTKDGGTQASLGTATHEGNGCWSFAPAQGDTDAGHVAFTFVNTNAVSVTVQVYTADKAAADALNASAKTIGYGTVGGGSSPTSVVLSAINIAGSTSLGANVLAGRTVLFLGTTTSAGLKGAGARITANTSGATPTLTLDVGDTLPATPQSGDLIAIL